MIEGRFGGQEITVLLTITSTQPPASDLGYLLHKNPARVQKFNLGFGAAHVFYPETGEDRCTVALVLDVDPVALVRRRTDGDSRAPLTQYVNDRPYVASSFLSVAIATVFGTALAGRSRERPDLADSALPLAAHLAVVPCRGGEATLRRLFEPLGYEVAVHPVALDPQFPDWGESHYFTLELSARARLRDLLGHLYVLVPVLDASKHYLIGTDEVEKLLRHGGEWLPAHPEREFITRRYLLRRRKLVAEAIARLTEEDIETVDGDDADVQPAAETDKSVSLNEQRLGAVLAALKSRDARRVLDLGCGEGRLLQLLLADPSFTEIVGVDASYRSLEIARRRLRLERLPARQLYRIRLLHGALTYRDNRLAGFDAAAVVEVIEHLDPARLSAFERVLFEFARPGIVVLTTPNREYNVRFPRLDDGNLRHRDHRFEWTRAEFREWATRVARQYGYSVRFHSVGAEDEAVGAPTQLALFEANGEMGEQSRVN